MGAKPLKTQESQSEEFSVDRELLPLLDAIARRAPNSKASLRERLRGGDRQAWPDDQARADARSEVHNLIDSIATRLEAEREVEPPAPPASAMVVSFTPSQKPVADTAPAPVAATFIDWPPKSNDPAFSTPGQPANEIEPEETPEVHTAPQPHAALDRRMPVWAAMALPITAVSVVALSTIFASQFAGSPTEAPLVASAAPVVEAITVADTAPIELETAATAAIDTAGSAATITEPVTAAPIPTPAIEPEPTAPAVEPPKVEVPEPPLPVFTPPPPKRPVKIFAAPNISASSAAGSVSSLLADEGVSLNKSEKRILGAALNSELDGLAAGMERKVDVLGMSLTISSEGRNQESQEVDLRVASDVQPLPYGLTLISDWFVADGDVPLHRGPDHDLASRERIIPMGSQVQRMAYYTDEAGEQWTLVGMHGIGIGYVPSDYLTPIEAYTGILGYPYSGQRGYAVTKSVKALTQCQTTSIGTGSGRFVKGKMCRDANGNWGGERLPVNASFDANPGTVTAQLKPLFD